MSDQRSAISDQQEVSEGRLTIGRRLATCPTSKYRVILPVEIGGVMHGYGSVIEIEAAIAAEYAHALIAVEEEKASTAEIAEGAEKTQKGREE